MSKVVNNEMQAKKPEKGDVFQSKENPDVRLYVAGINDVVLECLVSDNQEIWDIDSWYFDEDYYTYLGKSKANLSDLFKTENER